MASEAAHVRLVRRNQATIDTLRADPAAHAEWITTIAFYKALHLVEAVFADDPNVRHATSHDHRAAHLKRNNRYRQIWRHYRPPWAASMVARYLQDTGTGGQSYESFADYPSPDQIEGQILRHYLRQVEASARKLMSPAARAQLEPDA